MDEAASLKKALELARRAHENQFDKAGMPYIGHPLFVSSLMETTPARAAALLHDVIEDSDITIEELRNEGFDEEVIAAVELLTKKRDLPYEEYLSRLKTNEIAKAVKIGDLTHNSDISRIASPTEKDFKRIEKYKKALEFLIQKDSEK